MPSVKRQNTYNRKRKKGPSQKVGKKIRKCHHILRIQMQFKDNAYLEKLLKDGEKEFKSDRDKDLFVNKIYEIIESRELEYSKTELGSRAINKIISLATEEILEEYIKIFSEHIGLMSSHQYASTVLQELLKTYHELLDGDERYLTDSLKGPFKRFISNVSRFLLSNFDEYIYDAYGNRTIVSCLLSLDEDREREFIELVEGYKSRILNLGSQDFKRLCTTEITADSHEFFDTFLRIGSEDTRNEFNNKFLNEVLLEDVSNNFSNIFASKYLVNVLDSCLKYGSTTNSYRNILEKLFKGRTLQLTLNKDTSNVVEAVFRYCRNKLDFETIFNELMPYFGKLIEEKCERIIYQISDACDWLESKQEEFIQSLMKALNCFTPETHQKEFVMALCRFKPYNPNKPIPIHNLTRQKLNDIGALTIGSMIKFKQTKKMKDYLVDMDVETLCALLSTRLGHLIADGYSYGMIGDVDYDDGVERLLRRLQGNYGNLIRCRFGLLTLLTLRDVCNYEIKDVVLKELYQIARDSESSKDRHVLMDKISLFLAEENLAIWRHKYGRHLIELD